MAVSRNTTGWWPWRRADRLRLAPKVLKPRWTHFGVSHRVLNVLVAEIGLQRASIVSLIREGIAAGVAKHVWMDAHKPGSFPSPRDHLGESGRSERRPALGREHKRRGR